MCSRQWKPTNWCPSWYRAADCYSAKLEKKSKNVAAPRNCCKWNESLWQIQKFWKKSGGGQDKCVSPVVIYRKCTRWTMRVLYAEKVIYREKKWLRPIGKRVTSPPAPHHHQWTELNGSTQANRNYSNIRQTHMARVKTKSSDQKSHSLCTQ